MKHQLQQTVLLLRKVIQDLDEDPSQLNSAIIQVIENAVNMIDLAQSLSLPFFMEGTASTAETDIPQFNLTLEEAIKAYKTNDITAKGLVLIYCKLHPDFNPWDSTTKSDMIGRNELSLDKFAFMGAVSELEEEKKLFYKRLP